MRKAVSAVLLITCCLVWPPLTAQASPLEPFQPDEHTLLLYHFDEGQGAVAKDFLLGTRSRGLWVGCYVGMDFWYSGFPLTSRQAATWSPTPAMPGRCRPS